MPLGRFKMLNSMPSQGRSGQFSSSPGLQGLMGKLGINSPPMPPGVERFMRKRGFPDLNPGNTMGNGLPGMPVGNPGNSVGGRPFGLLGAGRMFGAPGGGGMFGTPGLNQPMGGSNPPISGANVPPISAPEASKPKISLMALINRLGLGR